MTTKLSIVSITAFCTYLCTYFFDLSMENMEQYLAVCSVLWLDGIFGVLRRLVKLFFLKCCDDSKP